MKQNSFFRRHKSRIGLGAILCAFLAACSVFVVMVQAQARVLGAFEKREVYVARRELPKGTALTDGNLTEYLELRAIDASGVPSGALSGADSASLDGFSSAYAIEAGTVLTPGMFTPTQRGLSLLRNPVLVGIRAEDLYQTVGGVLRSGDRIRVYGADEETGRVELLWAELYIADAFDSSGVRIPPEDAVGNAVRFNLYLEQGDVERFYSGLTARNLRIVKVCE